MANEATTTNAFLETALRYARLGWYGLPIKPKEKLPLTEHGFQDASKDEAVIRGWWAKWPSANLGVATGASGLVVVDADPRNGARMSFSRLSRVFKEAEWDGFWETTRARTGGGGVHFVFAAPPGVEVKSVGGALGDGLDVKGSTGYILVAPSIHPSGRAYEWVKGAAPWEFMPKPFPPALLALLNRPSAPAASAPFRAPERVPKGQHHTAIVRIAGKLTHLGFDRDAVAAAVWAQAEATFDPPPAAEDGPKQEWVVRTAYDVWDRYHHEAQPLKVTTPGTGEPASNGHHPVPEDLPDGLPANDVGNALRFIKQHGATVLHAIDMEQWFTWSDNYWLLDDRGQIEELAKLTSNGMFALSVDPSVDTEGRRKFVSGFARSSGNRGRLEAMVHLARTKVAVIAEQLDVDPWLMGVLNGTLDLRSGTLVPTNPKHHITKRVRVGYDPTAACPKWAAFIQRITKGDNEKARFLQQVCGYCLTGSIEEQVAFFFYGLGANGKSTFVKTLRELMGEYALHADPTTFEATKTEKVRSDIARLQGARLVSTAEGEQGNRVGEGTIKKLTGGEPFIAAYKFKNEFAFHPHFKLVWLTNHKPIILGGDKGIWRRVRFVTFDYVFPEGERRPLDDVVNEFLTEEGPGILAWCVRGALDWRRDNLIQKPPKVIREATEQYQEEMNPLAEFFTARCWIDPAANVASAELYRYYLAWAKEEDEQPVSRRSFSMRLAALGFTPRKGTGGTRIWQGIGLMDESQRRLAMDAQNPIVQPTAESKPVQAVLGAPPTPTPEPAPAAPPPTPADAPAPVQPGSMVNTPTDEYRHPEERRSILMRTLRELVQDAALGVDVAVVAAAVLKWGIRPELVAKDLRVLADRRKVRLLPNERVTLTDV